MSDYTPISRLYDAEHMDLVSDIELYRNFGRRCSGAVLELGCGSGRVSVPLAQAGLSVTGIDLSPAMLDLARQRAESAAVSARTRFEQADVRALGFSPHFSLAIWALNGFLHLATTKDQLDALARIHRALLPGGLLIVDLPNPHVVFDASRDGQMLLRRRFRSPGGGLASSWTIASTDMAGQVQHLVLAYDEPGPDGLVRRTTVEMDLRFVYRFEMAGLLRESGFILDDVYGSYDLDLYNDSSEIMMFVAYKPR